MFCTINHAQSYSPNGFHRLTLPGFEPATPRRESRHSDHAADPTCNRARAGYNHVYTVWPKKLVPIKCISPLAIHSIYPAELAALLLTAESPAFLVNQYCVPRKHFHKHMPRDPTSILGYLRNCLSRYVPHILVPASSA